MTDRTIPKILSEIEATKADASIDVDGYPESVRMGKGILKRQAQDKLGTLYDELRWAVRQETAAIILQGQVSNQEAYADLAEDEGEAITVHADGLYERLTDLVLPFVSGHVFTMEASLAIAKALYRVAGEIGVAGYNAPKTDQYMGVQLPDRAAVTALIREAVVAANGDEFAVEWVNNAVFHLVVANQPEMNVVPVIVVGATQSDIQGDFAAKLCNGRNVVVKVDGPPERNDVVLGFKALKPMFKRAKKG